MYLLRRLLALNSLVWAVFSSRPLLKWIPAVAAVAAGVSVLMVVQLNRRWRDPRVFTTGQQTDQGERLSILTARNRVRTGLVTRAGNLAMPPSQWVKRLLEEHPGVRRSALYTLARLRIHQPSDALSDEERALVLEFLERNLERADDRRLALVLFRMGGPPSGIFRWAERFRADAQEATWFFDGLDTLALLREETSWPGREGRNIQPWPRGPMNVRAFLINGEAAVGVFGPAGRTSDWILRAGGHALSADDCQFLWTRSDARDLYERRPLGAAHFREKDVRIGSERRGDRVPWILRRDMGDTLAGHCGPLRFPESGRTRIR